MKKNFVFIVAITLCLINSAAWAQKKIKEGIIRFEMTYPDSGEMKEMVSFMPKQMNTYFKNGDTRTESKMAMGNMVFITYAKSGDTYSLMDMMGKKMAMKMSKDDTNKMTKELKGKKPEVKITNETKMIAGIKCTKAVVTMEFKGEKHTYDVWFTKEIDAANSGQSNIEGVDGFTMEFTITDKGMSIHGLCTAIEQVSVADSLFKIPADYEVMNMNEMMNKMGDEH